MDKKKSAPVFIVLFVFYCFLSSGRACMTWGDNPYIDMLIAILCWIYFYKNSLIIKNDKAIRASLFLLLGAIYSMHGLSMFAYIAGIFMVLLPVLLLNLKDDVKIFLFQKINLFYAVLLVVSSTAWVLHMIGIDLPHTTETIETTSTRYGAICNNYFVFSEFIRLNPFEDVMSLIPRFSGFFLEPGHIGTITAFFLFATKYDFTKWYTYVYIFVIIISLSAAAFVLTAIGYVLYKIKDNFFKPLLVSVSIIIVLLLCVKFYNGGDNIINDIVLEKLLSEDSLDSRLSEEGQGIYEKIWSSGNFVFGLGEDIDVVNSAGLKYFFIMHGLIGCVLMLLTYSYIFASSTSRYGLFMLMLYLVSFTQRTYPYWDAYLDPFILGLPLFRLDSRK